MATDSGPLKVLVVDDNEGVRKFVRTVLERAGHEAESVGDGPAALHSAAERTPDLIILDLILPGMSGIEVAERVREWYRGPILVLSGADDEPTVVQALDKGADDYLIKPFRPNEMLARIRALMRRAPVVEESKSEIVVGPVRIDFPRRAVFFNGNPVRLTRTEFEILALLTRNDGRVLTSEEILNTVWGPHHGEYAQTLRVHIGHIRKKIEPEPSEPRHIITESGVGYRFVAEPEE